MHLSTGVCRIQNPIKLQKDCEDEYLIHGDVIGVADGVGGFADDGIDPAVYPKHLMNTILNTLKEQENCTLMEAVLNGCKKLEECKVLGGTTLSLLKLKCPQKLETKESETYIQSINIGDSGFLLFRPLENGRIRLIHKSPIERIGDYPIQLNSLSPLATELANHSLVEYKVFPNDIIVMATDGLFDNLFDEEVENIICKHMQDSSGQVNTYQLAKNIAQEAFQVSKNGKNTTPRPFASALALTVEGRKLITNTHQGKADDITVVVSQVMGAVFNEENNEEKNDEQSPTFTFTNPSTNSSTNPHKNILIVCTGLVIVGALWKILTRKKNAF